MVKANLTFNIFIYLYVICGLRYIIKIFWEKTDLAICNSGAATLSKITATCWCYKEYQYGQVAVNEIFICFILKVKTVFYRNSQG